MAIGYKVVNHAIFILLIFLLIKYLNNSYFIPVYSGNPDDQLMYSFLILRQKLLNSEEVFVEKDSCVYTQ